MGRHPKPVTTADLDTFYFHRSKGDFAAAIVLFAALGSPGRRTETLHQEIEKDFDLGSSLPAWW
jgi:hypothetical protein